MQQTDGSVNSVWCTYVEICGSSACVVRDANMGHQSAGKNSSWSNWSPGPRTAVQRPAWWQAVKARCTAIAMRVSSANERQRKPCSQQRGNAAINLKEETNATHLHASSPA